MSEPDWAWLPHSFVPFKWSAFWRKQSYLVRNRGLSGRVGRVAALMGLLSANQATWLADRVVAPNWDRVQLNGPVFIIGHQRTGSTLLHRTLATDPNVLALTLKQMLLPSVAGQRLLDWIIRRDAKRGGPLRARMIRRQERELASIDGIHRLRLGSIEEDEFVFFVTYRTGMAITEAPSLAGVEGLSWLLDFPSWSEADQRKALGWYRACLLKAAYRAEATKPNPDRWIAGKNPAFSQRIPQLLKVFPEAKFIHLVRSPIETIPSRLSLMRTVWRARYPEFTGLTPADVEAVVADSARTYLMPLRDLPALPPERAVTVQYEDLTSDLPGTLRRIYAQLRLPGEPPAIAPAADGGYRSGHAYSLEEFGLTEADIRERLAPAFAAHGF
ncbi:MAG: sulfotransferase [Bauldia sp.]|nr:sulfotransferase [Bauldia sp.]